MMHDSEKIPWVEKYRPQSFSDVISHDTIVNTLKTFINKKCFHHLLFYGPPGTGKTSLIHACTRELYGDRAKYMTLELNASDDRGIDVVRSRIQRFVKTNSVFGQSESTTNIIDTIDNFKFKKDDDIAKKYTDEEYDEDICSFKLVILDETDAMTHDAQAVLRKVMEDYTYNVRFCLICNYIQNINPALQSRCIQFRFSPLHKKDIQRRVVYVCQKEGVNITSSGMKTLINRSNGDMRKVLNNLQSVSMSYDTVNEQNVNSCFGYPRPIQIKKILNIIISDPISEAYKKLLKLKHNYGLSLNDIISEIHTLLINGIIQDGEEDVKVKEIIEQLGTTKIGHILNRLSIVEYNLSVSNSETVHLSSLIGAFHLV